ncbi:MAG: dephospho-CoA kinase [Bacteroidota bacterium]
MAATFEQPLTKAQLEILKVLSRPMTEEDIIDLKQSIVRHFAAKLLQEADRSWEQNNWTEKDTKTLRKRHFRILPYPKSLVP